MFKVLFIGLGGFLGAIVRFGIVRLLAPLFTKLPLGIWLANVVGSFLMGFVVYFLAQAKGNIGYLQPFLTVGFLGSLTTMSTFAFDTMHLFSLKAIGWAIANLVLTLVSCLLAVYAGAQLASRLF